MREIKFRGKIKGKEDWACGDLHHGIFTVSPYVCGIGVDPETVGQYTGLRDSKRTEEYPEGQEIYEGDVVCFIDATFTESGLYEQNCVGIVSWNEETVSFQVSNRLFAESYEVLDDCNIIGNIHDNPDLLAEVNV